MKLKALIGMGLIGLATLVKASADYQLESVSDAGELSFSASGNYAVIEVIQSTGVEPVNTSSHSYSITVPLADTTASTAVNAWAIYE